MESDEDSITKSVIRTVKSYQAETELNKDAISQIILEYEKTVKSGIEQLRKAAKRENNRWKNLLFWLESRKLAAQRKLRAMEEENKSNSEEYSLCLAVMKTIRVHIEKVEAKLELTRVSFVEDNLTCNQ